MIFEVHFTRLVEADNFFDAVDNVKEIVKDAEEVVSVCPFVEEDMIEIE